MENSDGKYTSEKITNIINYLGNANRTTKRCPFTPMMVNKKDIKFF
jgi:hypothetical protein